MNALRNYLNTRRSALSVVLEAPGPTGEELRDIVRIASRVPDHGKLAPWRFVHVAEEARKRMHAQLSDLLDGLTDIEDKPKKQSGLDKLLHGPELLMVVSRAAPHEKIPEWEQILSTGAACMNALIAANALGYEAQWLTAWYIYREEARSILGLSEGERVAGLIHIGSSNAPKQERPRPQLEDILSTLER